MLFVQDQFSLDYTVKLCIPILQTRVVVSVLLQQQELHNNRINLIHNVM